VHEPLTRKFDAREVIPQKLIVNHTYITSLDSNNNFNVSPFKNTINGNVKMV